jgi:hypothetical protein
VRALSGFLLVAAFLGGLNFVITYQVLARWWRTEVGRTMMAFALCETAVLGLSVLALAFGDFWGRQALSLLAFCGFTAVSWWRWLVLLKAQLPGAGEPHT